MVNSYGINSFPSASVNGYAFPISIAFLSLKLIAKQPIVSLFSSVCFNVICHRAKLVPITSTKVKSIKGMITLLLFVKLPPPTV